MIQSAYADDAATNYNRSCRVLHISTKSRDGAPMSDKKLVRQSDCAMESQQQVFLILNISTVYLVPKQGREKALIS